MQIQFLGTGTSCGVPMIGCECAVCRSEDPRDRRRRTSLYVSFEGQGILIDTPPDFREQALTYRVPRVDAVLFTHAHADHIFGFDDIRRYNTMQGGAIPAYADRATLADLRRVFDYVAAPNTLGTYCPEIVFRELDGPIWLGQMRVTPLPVVHGNRPTYGFLFEGGGVRVGYVPDCKNMPDETMERVRGVDVMILDALRHRPHVTHMTIAESRACLANIQAGAAYLIHMCHDVGHAELEASLPANIKVAYDGLLLDVGAQGSALNVH
ncbi:MAG: MBL fold metallo-hydrolase [Kiritimatiellia bacterium]